jgi:hypothetical protein
MATITTDAEVTEGQTLEMRLHLRLETLKENREKFLVEAQKNLAALDAAIGELSALLDPATLNGHAGGGEGDAG